MNPLDLLQGLIETNPALDLMAGANGKEGWYLRLSRATAENGFYGGDEPVCEARADTLEEAAELLLNSYHEYEEENCTYLPG